MNRLLYFPGLLSKFLLGTFFLVTSVSTLLIGAAFYLWNPDHRFERSPGSYFDSATHFIIKFQKSNARLPKLKEFKAWDPYCTPENPKGLAYYNSNFPSDLIRLAGEPPKDAYYFEVWDVDAGTTYYASWYENGNVGIISDKDYYWGGSRVMHATITLSLFIFLYSISIYYFSLKFEKSSVKSKSFY